MTPRSCYTCYRRDDLPERDECAGRRCVAHPFREQRDFVRGLQAARRVSGLPPSTWWVQSRRETAGHYDGGGSPDNLHISHSRRTGGHRSRGDRGPRRASAAGTEAAVADAPSSDPRSPKLRLPQREDLSRASASPSRSARRWRPRASPPPFPIQALTLPVALDGHDLIGQARTGTGKTLAFGIPILERLDETPGAAARPSPRGAGRRADPGAGHPGRRGPAQIAGARIGANVVTLYGGRAYEPQIEALATVDIVVGTPGRLLDLARQGHLNLGQVQAARARRGRQDARPGLPARRRADPQLTPAGRQTMLFSATMPGEVVTLARRHLSRPMHIRAEQHDEPAHVPTHRAARLPRPPDGQDRGAGPRPAGRGPRPDDRLLPDQAVRRPGRDAR